MDARVTGGMDLNWPEPGVCDAVPYGVFNDREVYDREMERIYQGPTWNFIGLAAEVANAGDYKSTFIGDVPVVMVRDEDGQIYAWENRCSHRGALVIRDNCGTSAGSHTCVYHQWSFNNKGDLIGVPFRKGLGGNGGMPEDFDMKENPLRKVRVEDYNGAVFGTFDWDLQDVDSYLGGDSSEGEADSEVDEGELSEDEEDLEQLFLKDYGPRQPAAPKKRSVLLLFPTRS